jgi:hypothetical protein
MSTLLDWLLFVDLETGSSTKGFFDVPVHQCYGQQVSWICAEKKTYKIGSKLNRLSWLDGQRRAQERRNASGSDGERDIPILGPKPAKRPFSPASLPSVTNLDTIGPLGPWPLFICDKSVSAGCMH